MQSTQWRPPHELQALQERKLADLLRIARRNVPYYRSLLGNSGEHFSSTHSSHAFDQIPPLTKEVIRRESERLLNEQVDRKRLMASSTSGSTGESTYFKVDERSFSARRAAELRSNEWTGWRLGERSATLWGAPMDQKLAQSMRGRVHSWITRHRFVSSYDLSAEKMDAYLELLGHFQPSLLIGYPGPLETFARHCRDRGAKITSLRAIVSSAETLWPHQREIIEDALDVKVFNRYGCREFGQIAAECEAHSGLHVSIERVLVEVVDDDGRPCAPGEEGRLLVTDLDNVGMPFIRYEIGDRGTWATESECACGRGLPLLQNVAGRTLEIVRTPYGKSIGGTFWTLLLRSRPGIRQFQVIQDQPDGIVIRFVRDTGLRDDTLEHFGAHIREHCGEDFKVAFSECDQISLTASGKQKIVISNLHYDNDEQR
jgi:phenylacetate-CoA ligase